MAATVVDLADYRRRKSEAVRREHAVPMAGLPMLCPVFYGVGWVFVPVMVPVLANGGVHA